MGLIKFSDYTGSEVAKAAMEALEMVGVINKLNINGYHLSIDGIQEKTPKGMINDTPRNHEVIIERNKFVCSMNKKEFSKLTSSELDNMLNEQSKLSIDFLGKTGVSIIHNISRDASNYVWYKHQVKFQVEQSLLETLESYVKRLFETTANYVIDSFESMTGQTN